MPTRCRGRARGARAPARGVQKLGPCSADLQRDRIYAPHRYQEQFTELGDDLDTLAWERRPFLRDELIEADEPLPRVVTLLAGGRREVIS